MLQNLLHLAFYSYWPVSYDPLTCQIICHDVVELGEKDLMMNNVCVVWKTEYGTIMKNIGVFKNCHI